MTIPMTVVDTIFKALAPACPERVIAGHHADLCASGTFGFVDPESGQVRLNAGGVGIGLAGGGGARKTTRTASARRSVSTMATPTTARSKPTRRRPGHRGAPVASEGLRRSGTLSRRPRRHPGGAGPHAGDVPVPDRAHRPPTVGTLRRRSGARQPGHDHPGGRGRRGFASGKVGPTRLEAGDGYVTATAEGRLSVTLSSARPRRSPRRRRRLRLPRRSRARLWVIVRRRTGAPSSTAGRRPPSGPSPSGPRIGEARRSRRSRARGVRRSAALPLGWNLRGDVVEGGTVVPEDPALGLLAEGSSRKLLTASG